MKNAFKIAISGAAFALTAALPAQANDLTLELNAIDMNALQLFASDQLALTADPVVDVSHNVPADLSGSAGEAEVVSDAVLDTNRGGQTLVVGNQTLEAITAGNLIGGDVSNGSVSLSGSAFSNFTGLGNIAINTGAQVSLQSGVNVIINLGQ